MDSGEYRIVYGGLEVGSDLAALSEKYGLDIDILKAILHQKLVRETMHSHHKIQANAKNLKKQWEGQESFMDIAKKINFTPVMTAWLILESKGIHRTQFRAMTRTPEKIPDNRLRKELIEALKNDLVYSPDAIANQVKRSKMVEEAARNWLNERKIPFIDEREAKEQKHAKTPDFLLKKTFIYDKQKIHWVECKASFGDAMETDRDYKKQLRHYLDLHGPGLVVYWYGFLSDITLNDVAIVSREFFQATI
jgi:hypothetical protein